MKRFDPIAVIALVLALIALLLVLTRSAPETPQAEEESAPVFDWVSHGLLALEPHGEGCAIRLEFPTRIEARPGDRIEWDVYNRCEGSVALSAGPREPVEGNRSDADDPFVRISETRIEPGAKSRIEASIKPQEQLTSPGDEHPSDRWRFRWQVNGAAQEDPEIEIEYRRGKG